MSSETEARFSSCDSCRARKFKCSKDRPTCAICLKQGRACEYSLKVARTPLTRENLTKAENRIRDLETAFSVLLPHGELEALLASIRQNGTPIAIPSRTEPVPAAPAQPEEQPSGSYGDSTNQSDSEALPSEADGFDWTENEIDLHALSDGMAALSIKPEGAGYLGATSSVVPLRVLLGSDRNASNPYGPASDRSGRHMSSSGILSSMSLTNVSQNTLVNAYFQLYNSQYPFIHESTFRAQLDGISLRPKGASWPILFNTVLTIGAWSIGDDESTMDDLFYNEVSRLCMNNSVFESGNIALVQALLLLSNYTQKRDRPNTGWNYLGLAVRIALSLGLHKEFPKWKITALQREIRRRVWWGVYIFDSGASITFGRPILLPEVETIDACQVSNIPDDALTPSTASLPNELEATTLYSGLIAQSSFHCATKGLYNKLISYPEPSARKLLDLEKKIDAWEDSIPTYFQVMAPDVQASPDFLLARYKLHWRSWNMRIVLFRPVILRWAAKYWKLSASYYNENVEEFECRQRCLEYARATINSISEFMANHTTSRLGTWYMLYFLFQAGLIPIIYLMTDPTHMDAPSWLNYIRATRTLLEHTSTYNQLAARCLDVVDRLCAPVLNDPEPEIVLQSSELFDGAHDMYLGDQFGTMEFWDWSNSVLQGNM